ncbi:2-nitropropane dioxygenase, partial [bacterium]|nr:2-nitropropane dioxygenase [bacterium]
MKTRAVRRGALGWWTPGATPPAPGPLALERALGRVGSPVYVLESEAGVAVAQDGTATFGGEESPDPLALPLRAFAPALRPEQLGDPAFRAAHGVRYAYVAGEMANGIGSCEVVLAMGRAGLLGFFGAAGLPLD